MRPISAERACLSALVFKTTSTGTPVSATSPPLVTATLNTGSSEPVRTTSPPGKRAFPATSTPYISSPCTAFGSPGVAAPPSPEDRPRAS
jgi:hypothetical protein